MLKPPVNFIVFFTSSEISGKGAAFNVDIFCIVFPFAPY